jgi:[NiFe] hydrogenase assembly HybE family chaperone
VSTLRLHVEDPSPLLEAAFRRIEAETMAGVPILNPALTVEAVGFTRWQDHWLGIVITPWFMNLVLVPGAAASWQSVAPGLRLFRNFPSGDFAFLGSDESEVGEFQSCSLFSPMGQFADQAGAREVALRRARSPAGANRPQAAPRQRRKPSKTPNRPPSKRPMSKREFLGGSVFRRG